MKSSAAHTRTVSSFYSDRAGEKPLYALLIRSPIASGTIRTITHKALPDGYRLFTAQDIPGQNIIRTFDTEFPVFASENVSYEGEPIGMLTGRDYAALQRLLTETEITYTQAFETAAEKEKPHDENILAERTYTGGNFDHAWEQAKIKADKTYSLNLHMPSNAETEGAFCRLDGKNLIIHTPCRWTAHLYRNIHSVLNVDKKHVHLSRTSFCTVRTNSPWHNTVLSVQCALAALLTGQPVLLTLSRPEQRCYIDRTLPVTIRHKTALNDEGTITAASVSLSVDAGAFNPFIAPLIERLALLALNVYKPENFTVEARAYRSHNPPGAPSVQWGDYHAFYAVESHIQELSRLSGINSVDIRLKNMFPEKKTAEAFPLRFDIGSLDAAVTDVVRQSDFYRKYASYKLNGFKPENTFSTVPLRGIGFSCGCEGNGFLGTDINALHRSLEVSMEKDGSAVIYANASSPTVANIWKNIAAELLSIPVESVTLDNCSGDTEETELPETLMSNIGIMSQLVKKCCTAIQKLRFRQPLPIRVKRSLTPGKKNTWNRENFCGNPFYTTSWAAAVAEIELNPKTYTYAVCNIWISIDGGTILYDSKAELTIRQCIRRLFSCSEDFQKNPLPDIFINFVPSSTEPKQIGELVFNVLPAAIGNAVCQALQKRIQTFPVTPHEIYSCIKETEQEAQNAHTADNQS